MDFNSIFNFIEDYTNFYYNLRPKIIKRKKVINGKRKYIKLYKKNYFYDILPSPIYPLRYLNYLIKNGISERRF